ncbi:MAG: hypothetical protein AB1806_19435 [Acidobacteriota bacterium]
MLDQSGYTGKNQTAFVNLQFLAGPRAEVFATTLYNKGTATIEDFQYDSSNIVPIQAAGLDFALMSSSFAGFSDLDVTTFMQTFGVNVRMSNSVVLNTTLSISDLKDNGAYLYDATGKRVGFAVGLNWIF